MELVEMVEEIQRLIQQQNISIQHIYREGSQLADHIANEAANEDTLLIYTNFSQLPRKAR